MVLKKIELFIIDMVAIATLLIGAALIVFERIFL